MNNSNDMTTVKIYNQIEFQQLVKNVKGLKIAPQSLDCCTPESQLLENLDNLVVSESLSCSYCNKKFEDKVEQRLHYKLEWHIFNLKQNLNGYDSVTEDKFESLEDKTLLYESEGDDSDEEIKNTPKTKTTEEGNKNYHTKVFFENEDGSTFSLYRCLLHNKKKPPESDHILVRQALECAKKSPMWTIILVGGGHFAGGVFSDGKSLVHKTFHSYTVRAKQGSTQSSMDNKNASRHPKSAGASLRRYNEASLAEHVQKILESWSSLISDSSLILYRAVGPHNRNILFGGKNTMFDKNDNRLRPLPFPTQKPTFTEVQRVYDILSNVEIHSNSPLVEPIESCKVKSHQTPPRAGSNSKKQLRNSIDRAKSRKSPNRPLPEIVARLAQSSESEHEDEETNNFYILENDLQLNFNDSLNSFECYPPRRTNKTSASKNKNK